MIHRVFCAALTTALCLVGGPGEARAELPRVVVADLHGDGDLSELAVGTSVLVAGAINRAANAFVTRPDAVEIMSRADLIEAFEVAKLPARTGLWVHPDEVRTLTEVARGRQVLTGVLRRDTAALYVTLRLVRDNNEVEKIVKLQLPLRQAALLPREVATRAGKLLDLELAPLPPVRWATLKAIGRAWLLAARKGDSDAAVVAFEQAFPPGRKLELAPDAQALSGYLHQNGEGASIKVRSLLAVDPPGALREAQAFAAANAANVGARFLLARALIGVGKSAEALEALRPHPGDVDAAEAHLLRARALVLGHQAGPAQQELRRALALNAENVEAHELSAEQLLARHDAQAAQEMRLAAARLTEQQSTRAVEVALRAFELDPRQVPVLAAFDPPQLLPDDAAALRRLLVSAQTRGGEDPKWIEAAALGTALGDDPAAAGALEALRKRAPQSFAVARLAALVAAEHGDHKLALEALRAALDLRSSAALALDAGLEARAAGRTEEASALLARAMADPSLEAAASRELGALLFSSGNLPMAIDRLRRAARVFRDDADVHAQLARALLAAGDSRNAGIERTAALALDPEMSFDGPSSTAAAPAARPRAPSASPPAAAAPPVTLRSILQNPMWLKAAGGVGVLLLVALLLKTRSGRRRGRRGQTRVGGLSVASLGEDDGASAGANGRATFLIGAHSGADNGAAPLAPEAFAAQIPQIPDGMPGLASLLVEVIDFTTVQIPGTQLTMSEKRPIQGAAVWVGEDENKAVMTEPSSGGAVLYVAPGEHTLHVRAGDKLLEQVLTVTAPTKIALIVDLADDVVVPRATQA
jgi:tetratricopeptide (TPR) repeat protein